MDKFLSPSEVLKQLRLQKSMVAADFGCGSGGWVIPLARKLEEGKVYAIDILEEPLSALKSKIKLDKILNIEIVKADVEKSTRLISESCSLVLMTNLLFEAEDIKNILKEGKRVLKKGGKILVVDWKKETPFGPPKKVSPEEVKKIAEEIGLKLEKPSTRAELGAGEFEASAYHWGLILVKPR